MKNVIRKLLPLIVLVLLAALLSGCNEGLTYQVDDVASDPGAFTKELFVVGVVSAYGTNDPTLIGIMDMKELQCTTPGCRKVLLPVRYNGTRPEIGAQVEVLGLIQGTILHATTLEVVAMHNLGGLR